jgi:hypothetical protein
VVDAAGEIPGGAGGAVERSTSGGAEGRPRRGSVAQGRSSSSGSSTGASATRTSAADGVEV